MINVQDSSEYPSHVLGQIFWTLFNPVMKQSLRALEMFDIVSAQNITFKQDTLEKYINVSEIKKMGFASLYLFNTTFNISTWNFCSINSISNIV